MFLTYARVSTAEQAADLTTSLETQYEQTRQLARAHNARGYDFKHFEDRGVSGTIPLGKRPAGMMMLAEARSGDVIIATKLDRIFRDARDTLNTVELLRSRNVDVICGDIGSEPIGSSPVGKMFLTIMAGIAEFERARILERMREGRLAKQKRNGHVGGFAPYGFRVTGEKRHATLEPVPEEQTVIEVATMLADTHSSYYHATKELNARGYRNRAGTPFQISQFMKLVRREIHASE